MRVVDACDHDPAETRIAVGALRPDEARRFGVATVLVGLDRHAFFALCGADGRLEAFGDHVALRQLGQITLVGSLGNCGLKVDQHFAGLVEHENFGSCKTLRCQIVIEGLRDFLDQAEVCEVDPDTDLLAGAILDGGRECDGKAIAAIEVRDAAVRSWLFDHRARQAVLAIQKLARHCLAEPGCPGEVLPVNGRSVQGFARGVDRVHAQHIALQVDEQHHLVETVVGHVGVHRLDERIGVGRVFPVGRLPGRRVDAEGLDVAVALEQVAIDHVADGDSRRFDRCPISVLDGTVERVVDGQQAERRQNSEQYEESDQPRLDAIEIDLSKHPAHFPAFSPNRRTLN